MTTEDTPSSLPEAPDAVLLAWGARPATNKGPKPKWSLAQLLDAAVHLGDEQGIDAITMSGLAKALGSGTMSLYRYVQSREDLLILAADHALGPGSTPTGRSPRERLQSWVRDLRSTYEAHPWLTATAVGAEPLLPSYIARLDTGLGCLEPLGLTGTRAITVLTMLWTYTRGDVEQATHLNDLIHGVAPDKINLLLAGRLRALTENRPAPRVLAVLETDTDADTGADEFEAAIDLVIDGIASATQV